MAEKIVYYVTKREGKDSREWKVFQKNSDKVIKLFPTQQEALDYAKGLCKNKPNASVILYGLDGKPRKQ